MASDTKPLRLHPHEHVAPRGLLAGLRAPLCSRSVALSHLSTALRLLWNSVFADFPSNGRSPENMASDRKPVRLHPHEHVAPLCLLARLRAPLCSRSVALSHLSTALRLLWNSAFAAFPSNGRSPENVASDRKPLRPHPHEHAAPRCLLAGLRAPLCWRSVALSHLSTALRLLWNSAFADFPSKGR